MTAKKNTDTNSNQAPVKDRVLAQRLANIAPYKFKKGQSGNPKGRPLGRRDYWTVFRIAIQQIADQYDLEPEQVEEAMIATGIIKSIKGDFFFSQDIANRIYGKPMDRMDVTSGGKTLADVIAAAHGRPKRGRPTKK